MALNRTGNCFEDCFYKIIGPDGGKWTLVHGMPLGRSGEAAKAGRYNHAWLEAGEMVWDPNVDAEFPKVVYYGLGNIVAAANLRYTRREAVEMALEHETSGPWAEDLLDRDIELDELFTLA